MAESLNRQGNAKHWTVFILKILLQKVHFGEMAERFNAGGLGIADG